MQRQKNTGIHMKKKKRKRQKVCSRRDIKLFLRWSDARRARANSVICAKMLLIRIENETKGGESAQCHYHGYTHMLYRAATAFTAMSRRCAMPAGAVLESIWCYRFVF